MKITLYENGEQTGEFDIQSVGREGTAWQTPLGTFDMSYKRENHFSSIGHVWMPYSMHFFGNYFIHGWPYYSDGTPVARGYSGGCIRLNTPDAEQIYGFVDKETRLIVSTNKKPEIEKEFQYQIHNPAPEIFSSYIVADLATGEVVASNKSKDVVPARSFSKLMTGLISLETLNQYQETVFKQDLVKVSDILYALLLEDNDEAGQLLWLHKNKNQYLVDMNTRAQSLAMSQTYYDDTNGDSLKTTSTLEDTFKLLQYLDSYKPFMFKVLSLDSYRFGSVVQTSIHPLKGQLGYVAGFTDESKSEMITILDVDIIDEKTSEHQKKRFAFIVLSDVGIAVQDETQKLHDWLKSSVSIRGDI
jgi:D-alanyl-D-alanine carboxypeptidase